MGLSGIAEGGALRLGASPPSSYTQIEDRSVTPHPSPTIASLTSLARIQEIAKEGRVAVHYGDGGRIVAVAAMQQLISARELSHLGFRDLPTVYQVLVAKLPEVGNETANALAEQLTEDANRKMLGLTLGGSEDVAWRSMDGQEDYLLAARGDASFVLIRGSQTAMLYLSTTSGTVASFRVERQLLPEQFCSPVLYPTGTPLSQHAACQAESIINRFSIPRVKELLGQVRRQTVG